MLEPEQRRSRGACSGVAALVFAIAVLSTACQRDTPTSAQTAQPKRPELRTVTIPVNGMTCVVCASRVKNALKAVQGVQGIQVNLETRSATVHYAEGKVNLDRLTQAINDLGYKAGVPAPTDPR